MKRLFLIIAIILMAITPASAQLSLYSINQDLHTNYSTTAITQAWVQSRGYIDSTGLTLYRLVADSYSTSEVDTLLNAKLNADVINGYYTAVTTDMFLSLKANAADVYTTAQVDLLLNAKLDASVISGYYTALQVDAKLLDYATTAAVALKIGRSDYFTDTLGGSVPPSGSTSGGTVLCDDGVFRSVASVGGGVTNAVDLNTSTATFSRIMNSTATNAQIAFNQIDANAAKTSEVAAVDTQADSTETAFMAFKNATETTNTSQDVKINALDAAVSGISTNQTVSVTAGENLTAGDVVSLINSYGTVTAKKNNIAVNTSPNGAESVFNSDATSYCSAVALDSTRFLVVYQKADGSPYARVGTISGSSISWGSESTYFESVTATYISVCKVATDKVLAVYKNGYTNSRMIVLSISTSTISLGTPVTFDDNYAIYNSLTTLDTDKAIVCYKEDETTDKGQAKIITVSGTVPTPYPAAGTAGTDFNAAATSYISCSALSATSAIVAYQDGGNSNYGTAQVLSISGTTITAGTGYVFSSNTTTDISCAAVTTTQAAITHRIGSNGGVLVATNSSGTLSYGTLAAITDCQNGGTSKIDSTHVLIAAEIGASNYGQSVVGTINGTDITLGTAYSYNTGVGSVYNTICYLGSNKSVIAYRNSSTSFGTAVVNSWVAPNYSAIKGISQSSYTAGQTANILLNGLATGFTSLVYPVDYYLQADFSIGTLPVSLTNTVYSNAATTREVKIGTSKSATELYVDVDYK